LSELTPGQVAALVTSVRDRPAGVADAVLADAGVHPLTIRHGALSELDRDGRQTIAAALRAARAQGEHTYWMGPDWTGLAFYGPHAAEAADRAQAVAGKHDPGSWRIARSVRPA
jgi:hypothetical protein